MPLTKPSLESLQAIRQAFASHDFSDTDLSELVTPKLGLITGFEDLMKELEKLRAVDLGATAPALGLTPNVSPQHED